MTSGYKYSCTIYGHDADVRGIVPSPLPCGQILSSSRDMTARLWATDSDGHGYHEEKCFYGHTNFTTALNAIAPSEDYPEGLIFTGCSDKIIRIFVPSSSEPVTELIGHTNTVCTLATGQFQMLLSGSWDGTARVWLYSKSDDGNIGGKQVLKLEGHTASVWAILLLQQGLMATGSADKTIKLWKAGKCTATLTGHQDCVRGLALVTSCQFLSCSNDATIKKWTTTGECLQTFYGHTNYIYSVSILSDRSGFVTSGEDRTMKVWNIEKSDALQTIALPAQSGWCVTALHNGDLAVALSDNTIRVFTLDSNRAASDVNVAAYESEVSASLSQPGEGGEEIDEKNVKPMSALETAGTKDGQVIMVRNHSVIEAHQWSADDSKWVKIGDVMSASNKKTPHRKTMYNGREYDFVFDVDIQEGAPTLKLPYDLSEDPWFAAQKFIDDNNLSQYFLDEVCSFITTNTAEARKKYVPPPQSSNKTSEDPFTGSGRYVPTSNESGVSGGQDPFTGGGRYVPMDTDSSTNASRHDPFTGGGRYVPGGGDSEINFGGGAAADPMINPNRYIPGEDNSMDTSAPKQTAPAASFHDTDPQYFPKSGFITFESANLNAIMGKLKTFSETCGSLTNQEVESLQALILPDGVSEDSNIDILWKILQWPTDYLLPALDILRLACAYRENVCKILCSGRSESDERPKKLLDMLCQHISAPKNSKPETANRLLSLRTMCNMFKYSDGSAFLMASYKDIFQCLSAGFSLGSTESESTPAPFYGNKNVQIAAASVLLNYSVLLSSSESAKFSTLLRELSSAVRSSCIEITIVHLVTGENLSDSEAVFRYLVCLGTLISNNIDDRYIKEAKALGAEKVVETTGAVYSNVTKIFGCTKSLSVLLFE